MSVFKATRLSEPAERKLGVISGEEEERAAELQAARV